jgi:hypothetical protein
VDDVHEVIDVTSLLSPSVPGLAAPGMVLMILVLVAATRFRVRERKTSHFRAQIWVRFGRSD